MIRITIQTGAHTYRISNQSHEHDGYTWNGRLLNVPGLELLGKVTDQENPVREIPLEINNSGGFIDIDTDSIWNATVTYENDSYADTWVGIVARYSESGEKALSIAATEQTQALFKLMIPDEVVRVANYTDAPRDAANTVVPMIFGGKSTDPIRTRAILVDRVNFRYLVCLGEIRQIVSVLKNRTAITEGFTTYTGTAGQSTYPGFAYIEFAADPRIDGNWPEILVDVVGLKLGSHTEEECRNPARILYYLLTTARTGACGWGLGRNVSELDAASFAQAITDCDSAGFKIDGAMDEQKYAPQWIDRITSACRGAFGQKAGKWALSIDKVSASVKHYGTGHAKMRVSSRGKGSMTNRKNQFALNYRYDATDGRYLGYVQRDDTTSQTALGTTSKLEDTNKLVSDHTAAGYIVDYYKRYEEYGEDRIEFTTNDFSGVSKDSVIEITRPDFGYSAKKFRVVSIFVSKRTAKIEARSYDAAIFENDTPGSSPSDPTVDPIPVPGNPNPPESPADVSIETNVRVQPDGTVIGYADIYFTPSVLALFTRIEVGEGATPSTWVELGTLGESGSFHHEPAKVGQNYTYRLTSVNTGGSSTPVTANVTIAADTTAPLVPQAPVLATYFKSIAVKCLQNLTKAPDHASFDVYRNTTNNSGTATKIGSAPCLGNTDSVVYLDEATAYDTTYYYWVKSIDTSGNISGFSAVAGPVSTQRIIAGDIGTSALNSSALFAEGIVDAAAIACGAVTAAKTCLAAIDATSGCLTACSVAAGNIQAGAITSEKIIATGITGACICAGTITASHLLVAAPGSALNDDPGFMDSSAWSSGSLLATVTDGQVGNLVARSLVSATQFHGLKKIPFDPSKVYRVRLWARRSATGNGYMYAGMAFQDCLGCNIAPGAPYWYYLASGVTLNTTWTEYYALFGASGCAAPSNAKTMQPLAILNYSGTSGYSEIQDFRVEEVLPGTLIQDGAITTSKIIATGISGACICAGSITTAHLSASGICADCVKAGTLCGVTVCTCSGNIGGWNLGSGVMYAGDATACIRAELSTPYATIYTRSCCNGGYFASFGKMHWGGWKCAHGVSVADGQGNLIGAIGQATYGSVTLPDSSTVSAGCPFFWVGDSSAYVKYNAGVLSVKGNIVITGGSGVANFDEITSLGNAIGLKIGDNRAANCPPCAYPTGSLNEFKCAVCIGISGGDTYGNLETVKQWGDSSGGYATQTYKDKNGVWRRRAAVGATSWGTWYKETNDTGALVSRVIPTHAAAPGTGTGLFLGCDYMGYYNGSAWKTYMDNAGKFYLTGTNGGLAWNGTDLVVCGTVCATAGCFSGTINATAGSIGFLAIACCSLAYNGIPVCGTFYGICLSTDYSIASFQCNCSTGFYDGNSLGQTGICSRYCCGSGGTNYYLRIDASDYSYSLQTNKAIYVGTTCYPSDRLVKEHVRDIVVLPSIRFLRIQEWSFKDCNHRRVGPMAQDFYRAFPMHGDSPEVIGSLDGIALKGVQELDGCVGCLQSCIRSLESRLANIEARLPACA